MKQKRKVKSLISSADGSNLWLTVLLFVLWWILCFWAVTLFTSSVWVHAADVESSIIYPFEDKHEVLLKFWLIREGGVNPVSEMYLTWDAFFISGDVWISVNKTINLREGKYINFLWWDSVWANIASDNVTIIWWKTTIVWEDNDNTAVLGWDSNQIYAWNGESAAPVMLWWEWNEIWAGQKGNAIVWWQGNKISDGSSYGFILGWNANKVKGDNVIVWWARVNVNWKSNVFAFSYWDQPFTGEEWNSFYLNLKNGL